MTATLTVECGFDLRGRGVGSRHARSSSPNDSQVPRPGRIPRVSRLMALAIRLDGLMCCGAVGSHAELARLGHVTRARMSQVMSLVHLAPDIQESILHLPPVAAGRAPVILRDVLPIAATPDWKRQRAMWAALAPPLRGERP